MLLHTQMKNKKKKKEGKGKEESAGRGGEEKGPHACDPRIWKVEEERTR